MMSTQDAEETMIKSFGDKQSSCNLYFHHWSTSPSDIDCYINILWCSETWKHECRNYS